MLTFQGDVAWVTLYQGEGPDKGMGNLRHKLIVGRLEARSIHISVLRVPFHKGSTAKQESLNVFTGAFHRGGAVVGGISKACSSCGVLGHVHPYDIPES